MALNISGEIYLGIVKEKDDYSRGWNLEPAASIKGIDLIVRTPGVYGFREEHLVPLLDLSELSEADQRKVIISFLRRLVFLRQLGKEITTIIT